MICSFPNGFKAAGATTDTLNNIRWGADYLLKTVNSGAANSQIVYQVGLSCLQLKGLQILGK